MKKICVVTGSRADYGLLKLLLKRIKNDDILQLQLVVTGSHFLKLYGETYKEIIEDGFLIDEKIEILSANNDVLSVCESIGKGVSKFAIALKALQPNFVLLLGDRFEIFAAAIAAHVLQIPIIHVHGGELTEGALDDSFRHSITKMSHLHFVATQEYANRVIQLGEQPDRVIVSGALGVDAIHNLNLLGKTQLEKKLGLKFGPKNLLITFHPVTLELNETSNQIQSLLEALSELNDTTLIFTCPNSDPESQIIFQAIEKFLKRNSNAKLFRSLGQLLFLSIIPFVDGVVGNSSSGLIEVPVFKKGTVNIGNRQQGRTRGSSVLDCAPRKEDILKTIDYLYSEKFQHQLLRSSSPYGIGGASEKILYKIRHMDLTSNSVKKFRDLNFNKN